MNKKIVLICGATYSVVKFRYDLVQKMKQCGFEVSIIALDNKYVDEINTWGVNFYCINSNSRSVNPIEKLLLIRKIKKRLDLIKPDIVFSFQTAPIIIGTLAAKKSKIKNIYAKLEGAGDVFVYNSFKWKTLRLIICALYKYVFKKVKKVIFENNDDKNEFVRRKLITLDKCVVIKSVGVDIDKYSYKEFTNYNTFLMIARLKPSKGVIEYCDAARIVKKKHPEAKFKYIGDELTLKISDIQKYIDDNTIEYLGYIDNIIPYLEDCFVHVLPSYREGFGLVTIQAGSIGRTSIVTDVEGSRDAVINNKTGYIVPSKNVDALVEKMIYALEHVEEMIKMGKNARELVVSNFDCRMINSLIVEEIENG